ncbi:MAG: cytochrome c [Methylohalobius sp.]|nr:cytochrome c [Methylohalobius sp.]
MKNIARIDFKLWAVGLLLWVGAVWAAEREDLIRRGEKVFLLGGCGNCHTAESGPLAAGGEPLITPFGTFYPPNLTPDPETGIGKWSEEEFIQALQEGISPEGQPYYPAFPFTSYTKMSVRDIRALRAYLKALPAVKRRAPEHELRFPFNLRPGLWVWRWLFFRPERFKPDPFRSETWNRGAYLVEAIGHCGECHTPRNFLGALDWDRAYGGAVLGEIKAPNITPDPDYGIGEWSREDLSYFLKTGIKPDGDTASGEMAKVIRGGTARLDEADLAAIIEYLTSLRPIASDPTQKP